MAKKRLNKTSSKSKLNLDIAEAEEYDYLLLNNPVFVNGHALAAAVAGATSLRSAVILALMGSLILIPVRLLGDLTRSFIKTRLRILVYALLSAAFSVPAMLIVNRLFPGGALILGLYLPLLFLDSLVLFRATASSGEGYRLVLGGALTTALGYSMALVLVGSVRELLSTGTLWDFKTAGNGILPGASGLAGGLIVTALLSALWQCLCRLLRKVRYLNLQEGEEEDE